MTQLSRIMDLLQSDKPTLDIYNECRVLLRKACRKGGEWDPLGSDPSGGQAAYYAVANTFVDRGHRAASEKLLEEWWDDYGLRQRKEKKRVSRAMIGFRLIGLYLGGGDRGAALRWALHTHADDMLGEHPTGGGGGKLHLRTVFGMSESDLKAFDRIAANCLKEIRETSSCDWSQPAGFAEEVVRRFAVREVGGTHILAEASSLREFHLSPPYFAALLKRARSAETPKEKGDTLEDFAFALFLLLPGCVPRRNLVDEDWAFESDIVVRNLDQTANLTAELFGRHFLVESKNWRKSVGVGDVGYFLYRMRLTHAQFGIIFSESGVSGGRIEKAARALVRRAFHEDGSICVVIDGSDLTHLAEGYESLWWMLLEKIEKLRFGGPRNVRSTSTLKLIAGIGDKRAKTLARAGICTPEELVGADPEKVASAVGSVAVLTVKGWQEEAGRLATQTPGGK